jgi:hypothetical protein
VSPLVSRKKRRARRAATSVVVVLLLAFPLRAWTLWSLVAVIICLRLRTLLPLVNRSNQLFARFGGVRAPVWTVVIRENGELRNVRTSVEKFVQEIDFINKSITSFRTAMRAIPLYFSPADGVDVIFMHNA